MTKTAKPSEPIFAHIPGLHWPQADEGALRAEAAAWRAMASALRRTEPAPAGAVRAITGGNSGAAVEKFGAFWDTKYAGRAGAFPELEKACDAMAAALDKYANAVDACKRSIEEKAAVLGATIVVGLAVAVFTLGIGADAAASAASAIVAFSLEAVDVTLASAAEDAISDVVAGALIGGVASGVNDIVVQTVKVEGFDDGSFSWSELGVSVGEGAAGGTATGLVGVGVKTTVTSVTEISAASPTLASVMDRLPTMLDTRPARTAMGVGLAWGTDKLLGGDVPVTDLVLGGITGGLSKSSVPDEYDVNTSRGRNFQVVRSNDYDYNRVDLDNGERLPSLTQGEALIGRRYTQFASISAESGVRYVRETASNFRSGTVVADTPYNRAHCPDLVGERVTGRTILEVPVQKEPLPPAVAAAALRFHVEIVDVTGRVLASSSR